MRLSVVVPPLAAAAGVQLFVDRARLVQADFHMDTAARADVEDLCACLDRIPLAIEMAAARLSVMSVRDAEKRDGAESVECVTLRSVDREQRQRLPVIDALCFDAIDLHRQARFWAIALGWNIVESDGEIALSPTDGTRFGILFEPTQEAKDGQNNIHLDLTSTSIEDQSGLVDRLIELGARRIDIGQRADEGHVVLADPEGNEFCIIAPDNDFLAGCGRLGAINADGTRRVGQFWSGALGWPLVWDQDDETAIRAPDGTGPLITWSGPPLMSKRGKNRLHLDIVPPDHADHLGEVDRLTGLGATRIDIGQGDVDWVVMADPDRNEFCVLQPRERASAKFSAV